MKIIIAGGTRYMLEGLKYYRVENGRILFQYASGAEVVVADDLSDEKAKDLLLALDTFVSGTAMQFDLDRRRKEEPERPGAFAGFSTVTPNRR